MLFLLAILIPAFAGYNGAVRTSPFAACRGHVADRIVRPWPASCRTPRTDGLKEQARAIAHAQQLAFANGVARKRIDDQLDLFIDSRAKLLVCMDQDSEDCRARVTALTTMLTTQAKRLRILLALSAGGPVGHNWQIVDGQIHELRLPDGLGGRRLPPLSAEEKNEVRETRERMLARLKYPKGEPMPGCRPSPEATDPCRLYKEWTLERENDLRKAAANVAEVLAHQLPLVTQVDEVPVTVAAARKILRDSQDVLRGWKSEVMKDQLDQPEALVHNYPRVYERILNEHPEYCDGVSAALENARARGKLKDFAWTAAQAGTAIAGCWFVGGVVCTGVGTGWSLWHLKDASWKAGVLRERYQSLGATSGVADEETLDSMLPYSDVKSAQKDAIVALAAVAVSATFLGKSVDKALDPDRIPSRPWSQQLKASTSVEKFDPDKTETIISKAGRKVERAVRRNANETLADRRFRINAIEKPIGPLEEELAELYSPAP